MARSRNSGSPSFNFNVKRPGVRDQVNLNINFADDFKKKFKSFESYFNEQLLVSTERLTKGGVTSARKALRAAETDWGRARMAGEAYGVKFRPYGRSAGREDTGFMYDSLTYSIETGKDRGGFYVLGYYGWDDDVIKQNLYIRMQELGFKSTGKFDPAETARTGKARFTEGREKDIPGANSLGRRVGGVRQRARAAASAAWNEAKRKWKADGFKGDPGSYMDYIRKRNSFNRLRR